MFFSAGVLVIYQIKKKAEKTALPKLLNLMIGGLTGHNNVFPVDLVLYSGSTFPSSPQSVS